MQTTTRNRIYHSRTENTTERQAFDNDDENDDDNDELWEVES